MSGSGSGGGNLKLKLNTSQGAASSPTPSASTPTLKINLSRRTSEVAQNTVAASQITNSSSRKAPLKSPLLSSASVPSGKTPASKKRKEIDDKTPASASKKPKLGKIRLGSLSSPAEQPKPEGRKLSVIKLGKGPSDTSTESPTTPGSQIRALRVKHKGKVQPRALGVGYDSEAEDAEDDPAIEENIVLRMLPGPDCEYVRNAIEERKMGLPTSQGGADVSLRFFTKDGRRAALRVRDRYYAAVLVDLPCIVETMKSWDRKGWWKSADVCQMLLVTEEIRNEDAARDTPLPREVDKQTWQWPHGLTPPMHNVRKRRFRKRVDHKTIEQAELEVERLLELDEQARQQAGTTSNEILDLDQLRREEEGLGVDQRGEQDAEGDIGDDEDDADWQAQFEAHFEAQFEAQLGADDDEENEQPDTTVPTPAEGAVSIEDSQAPPSIAEGETPSADAQQSQAEDSEAMADTPADTPAATPGETTGTSTDDEDDEDDGDDGEEEIDDEERERQQYLAQQREEIAHLDRQIAERREQLAKQSNPLLKSKLVSTIKKLEEERVVKKHGLGDNDDDE